MQIISRTNQKAWLWELRANEKPCWFVYKQTKSQPFKLKQIQKSFQLKHPNEQQLNSTSSNLKQPHLKMDYAKAVKGKF
jgi:hypothetical protein